jgi:glutaredoxin
MINLLSRLVRRSAKSDLSHVTFTVYSRKDCGCCHHAIELLQDYRQRYGFVIDVVDVDSDARLVEEHGLSVPVVALNGKIRFKGEVNPALLER